MSKYGIFALYCIKKTTTMFTQQNIRFLKLYFQLFPIYFDFSLSESYVLSKKCYVVRSSFPIQTKLWMMQLSNPVGPFILQINESLITNLEIYLGAYSHALQHMLTCLIVYAQIVHAFKFYTDTYRQSSLRICRVNAEVRHYKQVKTEANSSLLKLLKFSQCEQGITLTVLFSNFRKIYICTLKGQNK